MNSLRKFIPPPTVHFSTFCFQGVIVIRHLNTSMGADFAQSVSHMSLRHFQLLLKVVTCVLSQPYGFNCKIIYIEGHKNKVADTLSRYYSSSSDKDLHYDDFVSADIRIDNLGENLPLSHAEEAWEMLFPNELHLVGVRIAAGSLNIERDLQADQLNPPNDCIGRRELSLADLVTLKENLQDLIETKDFLDKIQEGYSKQNAWKNILENPTLFPTFRVDTGFILHLNDLGKPQLVLPEVIHKGERIPGIMIKNAHIILGHLGFQKTLEYIQRYYWWSTMVKDTEKFISSCEICQTTKWTSQQMPGLLHQLPIPDTPWMSIRMDFVGPFPKSLNSNYLWGNCMLPYFTGTFSTYKNDYQCFGTHI